MCLHGGSDRSVHSSCKITPKLHVLFVGQPWLCFRLPRVPLAGCLRVLDADTEKHVLFLVKNHVFAISILLCLCFCARANVLTFSPDFFWALPFLKDSYATKLNFRKLTQQLTCYFVTSLPFKTQHVVHIRLDGCFTSHETFSWAFAPFPSFVKMLRPPPPVHGDGGSEVWPLWPNL